MKKKVLSFLTAILVVMSSCMLSACPRQQDSTADTAVFAEQTVNTTESTTAPEEPSTTQAPTETTAPEPTEPPVVVELPDSTLSALAGKEMTASHYFVYDCDAGLFMELHGSPIERVYPASVTKLFTAYVALQYIDTDVEITAGSILDTIPEDASVAGLQQGDVLTAEQLVAAMLLPSGNDAAYVLAVAVGRILEEDPELDSQSAVARFVEQMNLHAQVLGMTGTHFANPDGMHSENHYTCLADLTTIGTLVLKHPVLSKYAADTEESIQMDGERTLEWHNTNALLHPESEYYCPYAIGLKTGYTSYAGQCLLSAFQVGDQRLLIGVFGCSDTSDRFAETLLLFAQTFELEIPEETTNAVSSSDGQEDDTSAQSNAA